MSSNGAPSSPKMYDGQTLAALLEQLHRANEHFDAARQHLETLMNWRDYDHPDHDRIEQELRRANAELVDVTSRIDELLKKR